MNINERMAEVMGWKRLMWWLTLDEEMPCWISTNEDEVMRAEMSVRDWHPDTDLNQAMMCVRKLVELELELYTEVDLNISPNGIDIYISKYKHGEDDGSPPLFYCLKSGNVGEEAKTICEAILEVL